MAGIETSISIDDMLTPSLDNMISALDTTVAHFRELDIASNSVSHIRVNSDGLVELDTEVRQAENSFRSLGGVIAGLGLGYLIKEQFSSAVEYASDLTEVQNVVDVAFGETSQKINEWAEGTIDSVGLSELSAKQYAGTMGAMLKSSGLAGEAVDEMSMSITELAGDMASFYNLDTDVAFEKIRSGISGETEPLKQLGINMSVANLEAYALSQGINTAYSEMSQAQQTQLRYNYLMQQTADAQGDYARTSDSYANQIRHLEQSWQDFTGELASNALPVLSDAVGLLNDGITGLSSAVDFMGENMNVIIPVAAGLTGIIGTYEIAANGATIASNAAAAATELWAGAQAVFNTVLDMCPIVWIIMAVMGLIAVIYAVVGVINNVTGETLSATGIIFGAIATVGAAIWNIILGVVNGLISYGVEAWNFIATFANFFGNVFNDPVAAIAHLFVDLFDTIVGIVQRAAAIIDTVLGTDMASSVQGFRDDMQAWIDDTVGEQTEYVARLDATDYTIDGIDYKDAWDAGYKAGDNLFGDGAGNSSMDGIADSLASSGVGDAFKSAVSNDDLTSATKSIASSTADTADTTAAIADSLDITSQSIKYIRDFAEQRAINRYTGTIVNVEMINNNSVSSDTDVDSIARRLVDVLNTEINTSMEGVH